MTSSISNASVCWVRSAHRFLSSAVVAAAILPLAVPPAIFAASASVGSRMDSFLDDANVAANVTGPTAFEGQSAGYYSLGNVWSRFPQKRINPVNLQLPSARAGCGGIDIFGGSFSFINSDEIIAMLKATANNAVGFAFSLAIDTVCPECNKIMQEFSQKAQLMNNFSMSSCEMAQGLVGGLWPQGDLADKAICEAIGNKQGIFTDAAAAKHGCGNKGERSGTLAAADAEWDDVNSGTPRNFTWHAIRKSDLFQKADGTLDVELAEYVMTLVGTDYLRPAWQRRRGTRPLRSHPRRCLIGTRQRAPRWLRRDRCRYPEMPRDRSQRLPRSDDTAPRHRTRKRAPSAHCGAARFHGGEDRQ